MRRILTILLVTYSILSFAGNENLLGGARSAGLANASVTLSDGWSLIHNQAGLGRLEKMQAGLFYENRFALKQLGHYGAVFAVPTESGTFGFTASSFGYSLYRESKFGMAYGRKLGEKISAGIQIDYLSVAFGDIYGNNATIAGEIGVQAELTDELSIGAHIYNVGRAEFAEFNNERIPTIIRFGLQYTFSEKVFTTLEMEKDIDFSPVFKGGFEYRVVDAFYLRAGVSTNPALSALGFGYQYKGLRFDFAGTFHSVLGFTPQWSLVYQFK